MLCVYNKLYHGTILNYSLLIIKEIEHRFNYCLEFSMV